MKFGRKLAVFLAKKNIKKQDFAEKIGKHPVEVSYYINGIRKKPRKITAHLINSFTDNYITMKDMGYAE